MNDRPVTVELQQVARQYDAPGGGRPVDVLAGVDLSVRAGDSVAIVGPSGSGKSTLLNIIGALDRPTSGTVRLEDRNLAGMSDAELARVRNRRVGMVFQLHHLLPQCTVLENVLIPTLVSSTDKQAVADRARQLIDRVGLTGQIDHRPGQLSGGQRQRVAVARALVNDPAILLADEPTGSLDRDAAEAVTSLLTELNRQDGVTLILATHSLELARRTATVLALRDGKLEEK